MVELCQQYKFDFICLQETIKDSYTRRELDRFSRGDDFFWDWIPPRGHSGGMLMRASSESVLIMNSDQGVFFHSLVVKSLADDFIWELINVYGPVQSDRKADFLAELKAKIQSSNNPLIVGVILTWLEE